MNHNRFKDNILIQYTIISFSLTLLVALVLSWQLSIQMRDQLIYSHGDFYRAYAKAINRNYLEIVPIINETDGDTQSEKDDSQIFHGHGEDETEVWDHFESDLIQFPYVKQFRIISTGGEVVWKYRSDDYIRQLDSFFDGKNPGEVEVDEIRFLHLDESFAVGYSIPIIVEEKVIGTVQIIDIDPDLKVRIDATQKRVIFLIVMGGTIFYLSLFFLYYRVHRRQVKAIIQLDESQSLTIETMSRLAELRDDNTGAHIRRTSLYCRELAVELSRRGTYSSYLSHDYIMDLERSAPLHDIGKVGIPDSILQKPGPLTDEEFNIIKTHTTLGANVLSDASHTLEFQSFFEIGYQLVLHHHENWDGSGYPEGLSGEDIPLSARIMSVADVYDALTTDRPYKKAYSHDKAMDIIMGDSGKKFDPLVVQAFSKISARFSEIALLYSDND